MPEATSSSWRNSAIASTAPTTAPKSIALLSVKMNFAEIVACAASCAVTESNTQISLRSPPLLSLETPHTTLP